MRQVWATLPNMGSPAENKALVSGFLDAWAVGDIEAVMACFDAEIWSDVVFERVALIADEDRVAYHGSFTGTHSGPFLGLPPTGRRITMALVDIWRVDDDKIVEHWGGFQITDAVMTQLRQ